MPHTCLIAAHDPWFIQLLRIYSEESGFRVVQVYECQDVLPMVHQENPAAVMMQVDLPGKLKGREVLRLLKADPHTRAIPVMVFSWQGHAGDGEMPIDWLEGAAAYLQEPVTFENFQDALQKAGLPTRLEPEPTRPAPSTAPSSAPQPSVKRPDQLSST